MKRSQEKRISGLRRLFFGASLAALFLNFSASAAPVMDAREVPRFDGSLISYHITRDASLPLQPLLLILQGSDCNSVTQNPSIDDYARAAPKSAVLYVEKYGITDALPFSSEEPRPDCPDEYLRHATLEQRILDCLQVLAHLKRSAQWWNRELVLIGGSSGALIASSVAALSPEASRVVIFGFGSRRFTDDLSHGIETSMRAAGAGEKAIAKEQQAVLTLFKMMERSGSTSEFVSGHSYSYWASMLRFDQYSSLASVAVPILAIQGSADQSVSAKGAKALVAQLHANGRRNVEYREYPGLDHGFVDRDGVNKRTTVIEDMASWIASPAD